MRLMRLLLAFDTAWPCRRPICASKNQVEYQKLSDDVLRKAPVQTIEEDTCLAHIVGRDVAASCACLLLRHLGGFLDRERLARVDDV